MTDIETLARCLPDCLAADRDRLAGQLSKIRRRLAERKPSDQLIGRLQAALECSLAEVERRRNLVPPLTFPEQLPVSGQRDAIQRALADHQVVVVAGETGSGKTTQLPKLCLELGRGCRGLIGHTQPRRIAARTVASRIAEEINIPLGGLVGYQVRFAEALGENTLVKLMTDGVLLAEIQRDPLLLRYDTLIIDEAHERSLNIDFLLGYLKQLLPRRPDLKLLITSATIDVEKFARHFDNAPVIEVSGRTFPVEVVYRPPLPEQQPGDQVLEAIEEILTLPKRGDILVFLPGERDIREAAKQIRAAQLPHISVVPLYGRLSLVEQNKVFSPHAGIRVVLATNVAETSLTVPGIRYVIDPGTARISRYSYRSKVQRLPIEAVSRASANQRKGRCGRVSDGVCYRLYSEEDFNGRAEYTDPEIVRTNLAAVILQMLQLKIGDIRDFPFVDPPDNRLINDGFTLLQELQAVGEDNRLTPTGRALSQLPVDPRLAAMLLQASRENALREVLIIVSALSLQDPRERPGDKQQAADEKHRQWRDGDSDFAALLNIWNHFEEQRQLLSRGQFDKYCQRNFIAPLRMREWRDMHHQLHGFCRQLKFPENHQPADYAAIHRSVLAGLLSHIGFRHEAREYLGTRNRKFYLFPGSGLSKKPPKWVMAVELLETSRLFAHHNARIDEAWLPELAGHLVKKSYSNARYDARRGQVVADEKQTLLGLTIVESRRCAYGGLDPVVSRELFIRGALVEGLYRGKGGFFQHNRAVIKALEDIEAKVRRRDILVDDQALFDFYAERIPSAITGLVDFEHWRKQAEREQPKLLFVSRERLIRDASGLAEEAQFPNSLHWEGYDYKLTYRFQPGEEGDGVSVDIPLAILHQVPLHRFEWLVPGLLREKCIAMIKALPKQLRRHLVPVPDYVERILPALKPADIALKESLSHQLLRETGMEIGREQWRDETLDSFYRANFRLLDEAGSLLAESRDLTELKSRYRSQFRKSLTAADDFSRDGLKAWDFDELPEDTTVTRDGLTIKAYPALVLSSGTINRRLLDNPVAAENHTRRALVQLYLEVYPQPAKYSRKQLLKGVELQLRAAGLPERAVLLEDIVNAVYQEALLSNRPVPRARQTFEAQLQEHKGNLAGIATDIEKLVNSWLEPLISLRRALSERRQNFAASVGDVEAQLQMLFEPDFLQLTPVYWLRQFARYLKAALLRLERLPAQQQKDQAFAQEMADAYRIVGDLRRDWLSKSPVEQEDILKYRFMLEEYRVSFAAQQLGTALPVSEQRLARQLAKIEPLRR